MSRCSRVGALACAAVAVLLAFDTGLVAQSTARRAAVAAKGGTSNDEEFARLVKEWTTRPEFSSPLVDHLPRAAGIPTTNFTGLLG